VALVCGIGMSALGATLIFRSFEAMVLCFSIATFAYAGFSTIVLTLPADLYRRGSVATVSGMSGTGAGIGTIAATYITGVVADRFSFEPILLAASVVPLIATVILLVLVRGPRDGRQREVLNAF
jgi:ACS family hexuronate transporter-like MFS transporter